MKTFKQDEDGNEIMETPEEVKTPSKAATTSKESPMEESSEDDYSDATPEEMKPLEKLVQPLNTRQKRLLLDILEDSLDEPHTDVINDHDDDNQ